MGMKRVHESIRVFKNPYLERLTHVHPITPLVLWVPVVCLLLWRSLGPDQLPVVGVGATLLFGMVFWTLAEYLLHRYIFHFYGTSAFTRRIQFLIHGLHHDDPVDPTRLVMPPAAAIILAIILYSSFRVALGRLWVDPFFAGFVMGYLCYDYIHYGIHHFNPRSRVGRWIKKHHMLHHFATPEARWGVSSPLWDLAFGTLGQERPSRRGGLAAGVSISASPSPSPSLGTPTSAAPLNRAASPSLGASRLNPKASPSVPIEGRERTI